MSYIVRPIEKDYGDWYFCDSNPEYAWRWGIFKQEKQEYPEQFVAIFLSQEDANKYLQYLKITEVV